MVLTKGDQIVVQFNKKEYGINITSCKPKDAVSLTNVDVKVDFLPPCDYDEEEEVNFS